MANQCRSKGNQGNQWVNKAIRKNNIVCYACNKIGNIAKYRRTKNPSTSNGNADEKGKEKVEDNIKQHEKRWVRRSDTP